MSNQSDFDIAERRKIRNDLIIEIYRIANGGRAMKVALWEIALKMGINNEKASDIYQHYYDRGFFSDRGANQMVVLSYLGVLNIEDSILRSQNPIDLVPIIEERQKIRFSLLKKLFDETGGSSHEKINFNDLARRVGVQFVDVVSFLYHLEDAGLVQTESLGGWVSITSEGINKIEEWYEGQSNEPETQQSTKPTNEVGNSNTASPTQLREKRYRIPRVIYELAGDDKMEMVLIDDIVNAVQSPYREVNGILMYLERKGLVVSEEHRAGLSADGVDEVEETISHPERPTENFPQQITQHFYAPFYGANQAGGQHNTQNVSVSINPEFDKAATSLLEIIGSSLSGIAKEEAEQTVLRLQQLGQKEESIEVSELARPRLGYLTKALSITADVYTLAAPPLAILYAYFKLKGH